MKKVIIFTCTMYFSYDVIMMCLDISQAELFGNAVQSHDSQDDSPNVSSFPPSPSLPISPFFTHISLSLSPHMSLSLDPKVDTATATGTSTRAGATRVQTRH